MQCVPGSSSKSLGAPDPFRVKYRELLGNAVQQVVTNAAVVANFVSPWALTPQIWTSLPNCCAANSSIWRLTTAHGIGWVSRSQKSVLPLADPGCDVASPVKRLFQMHKGIPPKPNPCLPDAAFRQTLFLAMIAKNKVCRSHTSGSQYFRREEN